MKKFEFVLLLAISILLPASYSFAAQHSVPIPYATIQAAITAAEPDDVVLVSAGTYEENINFLGKAITVQSASGAASTIIDGGGSGTLVTFNGGEGLDSVLDGFTVSNGRTGIYFSASSSATITDCIISNNSLSGVSINGSSPLITNSIISSNSANLGGGISCRSSNVNYRSSPTITNSTISGNTAQKGGGIYGQYYCSITIQDSTISDNTATFGGGGGIFFTGESLEITGSAITGNTAGNYNGGGIYAVGDTNTSASLFIRKSDINGNSAGYGGGIYSTGTPFLTNTLVTRNTADKSGSTYNDGRGGGIYTNGCTVMNCTIADNTALSRYVTNPGGGIYASKSYPITITNSILYGNKNSSNGVSQIYPATINPDVFPEIQITYNNINQVVTGLGNINTNPWFVDSYNGDYHQRADGGYYGYNPSIDKGTSIGAPSDDLDGASRPARYGYDMGAYEVPPCLPDGDGDGYYPSPGCGTDVDCDDADPDRHPGRAEVCNDGKDNNCDEDIDSEDSDCTDGCITDTTGYCYSHKAGECGDGTRTCVAGNWGDCVQDTQPTIETCDGLDNDCNGLTDEFLATPVCDTSEPGVCAAGTQVCQAGVLECVSDTSSSTETCDGLDNDCDGTVDEELVQGCDTGLLGVCTAGTETCDQGGQGTWGACVQENQATTEICDGLDNNCNDQVDEGFDADSDGTADCYDGCPYDPEKTASGTCGCGTAETDTDGDGTLDCNDSCPDDPGKTVAGICGCGVTDCPQLPIIAPDGTDLSWFGSSVAISDDGTTAVVGATGAKAAPDYYGNEFASGRVYIYTWNGSSWTLQQNIEDPAAYTGNVFGSSVSISWDGTTILVGANRTGYYYINEDIRGGSATLRGCAHVYIWDGTSWTLQASLTASDGAHRDDFGISTTLSHDGNTAVIGAPGAEVSGYSTDRGAAYVFVRNGTTWTQQQRLNGTGTHTIGEHFGRSAALSDDGNTLIVGAEKGVLDPAEGFTYYGLAYAFTRSATVWTQEDILRASDYILHEEKFGYSISISGDGNTALIGKPGYGSVGDAYLFTRADTTWSEQQIITPSDSTNDYFGGSVSLSGDANKAIIGARYAKTNGDIITGAAYVFSNNGTTWEELHKHFSEFGQASDYYGQSVAISDDGYTALAGAPLDDAGGHLNQGAVYVIPTVIEETNIAPGAVDVAVDTGITITFDQPMDGATIIDTTFTLTTDEPAAGAAINSEPVRTASINEAAIALAASVPVPGTVSYDETSMTATFTPSSALAKGTKYTVALVGAKYANGTAMVPYIWSFTTLDTILSGDIDNDGNVNLADAILALKILSNVTISAEVLIEVDVNNDGLIGLEEAVYTLQVISERRP